MKFLKAVLCAVWISSAIVTNTVGITPGPGSNNFVNGLNRGFNNGFNSRLAGPFPANIIASKNPIRFSPDKINVGRFNGNSFNGINGINGINGGFGRIVENSDKGASPSVSYFTSGPDGSLKPIPPPGSLPPSGPSVSPSLNGQLVRILHQSPTGTSTKLFRIVQDEPGNSAGFTPTFVNEPRPEIKPFKAIPPIPATSYGTPILEYSNGVSSFGQSNSLGSFGQSNSLGSFGQTNTYGGLSEEDILKIVRNSLGINAIEENVEIKVLPEGINYGPPAYPQSVPFESSNLRGRTKVFEVINPATNSRQIFNNNNNNNNIQYGGDENSIQVIQTSSSLGGGSSSGYSNQFSGGFDIGRFGRELQEDNGKVQYLQLVK